MELEQKVMVCERAKTDDKMRLVKQKHDISACQMKVRLAYTTFSCEDRAEYCVHKVEEKPDAHTKNKFLTYHGENLISLNILI